MKIRKIGKACLIPSHTTLTFSRQNRSQSHFRQGETCTGEFAHHRQIASGTTPRGRWLFLTTDFLAKGVDLGLDGADAFFSDNYFDLIPGDTLMVDLYAEPSDLERLDERITIRTLYDTIP